MIYDDEFSRVTIVSPKNPEIRLILVNVHKKIRNVYRCLSISKSLIHILKKIKKKWFQENLIKDFGKRVKIFDDGFSRVIIVFPKNSKVKKILIKTHRNIQDI